MAEQRGQPPLHSRLKLLFWLFVAALSQGLVAAFGVLSRQAPLVPGAVPALGTSPQPVALCWQTRARCGAAPGVAQLAAAQSAGRSRQCMCLPFPPPPPLPPLPPPVFSSLTHPSRPLDRYLQTHTQPPVPPLRLVVLVNIVGLATCLLIHALPVTVRHLWRRRRERVARQQAGLPTYAAAGVELGAARTEASSADSVKVEKSELSRRSSGSGSREWQDATGAAAQQAAPAVQQLEGTGGPLPTMPSEAGSIAAADSAALDQQQQQQQQQQAADPAADEESGGGAGPQQPPPTRLRSTVRPSLPLQRGMSARFERVEQQRPLLYRSLALAALTTAFACGFVGQISAPGLVDPSIGGLLASFSLGSWRYLLE